MPHYGLGSAIKATGETVVIIARLQNGDTAASLLPPDTKFAIVIEAIQRGANDSFWETDTSGVPGFSGAQISAEGIVGRFIGYLSFSDSKVRIFRALDVNAAASGQPLATDFTPNADGQRSLQLLLEDDIVNLSASLGEGEFVISNATQKFKLLSPYPINHLNGRFESSATGFNNGLSPTLNYMASHGARGVPAASKSANTIGIVVLAVAIFGLVAVIVLSRRH